MSTGHCAHIDYADTAVDREGLGNVLIRLGEGRPHDLVAQLSDSDDHAMSVLDWETQNVPVKKSHNNL